MTQREIVWRLWETYKEKYQKNFVELHNCQNISTINFSKKHLLLLGTFLSLISLWTGWRMWSLFQQDTLWGHLPLLLLLTFWGAWIALRGIRSGEQKGHWRYIGLASFSGIFLSLGFPPSYLTPLMFIGFVPLLLIEKEISASNQSKKGRKVFRYAYSGFVLWNILTTFWVFNTHFVAGWIAVFANSLLMSLPFMAYYWTKRIMKGRLQILSFIAFWITFEYLHMRWEITWPWLTLGNSFARYPALVQWYEFTGTYGGSLWILLGNVLVFRIYELFKLGREGNRRWEVGKLVCILLLPIIYSLYLYAGYEEKGVPQEVVVVQPNFEPHYEKFKLSQRQQLNRFLQLSNEAVGQETDYLVFPETSFSGLRFRRPQSNQVIQELQRFVNRYEQLKLVTGLHGYLIFRPGEERTPYLRKQINAKGDTTWYEAYNMAAQLESGQTKVDLYRKSKFVPGAEIFPYRHILFFVKPIVESLGGASVLAMQKERTAFKATNSLRVAPVICYESVFGEYVTGYVKNGANALFIVTNDGWWDNTAGHKQHLLFASLRAIETRRAIARSANTGISCLINQRGDILQPTKYDEPTTVKGTILFNDEITFYVRYGDLIGRVAGFVSILLLLNSLARGLINPSCDE